jgi:uncharacterized metal-binding protein
MDNEYNDPDININICQAVGCPAKATDKIAVKVGTLGVISLLLCRNGIGKFQDHDIKETDAKVISRKRGAMI